MRILATRARVPTLDFMAETLLEEDCPARERERNLEWLAACQAADASARLVLRRPPRGKGLRCRETAENKQRSCSKERPACKRHAPLGAPNAKPFRLLTGRPEGAHLGGIIVSDKWAGLGSGGRLSRIGCGFVSVTKEGALRIHV